VHATGTLVLLALGLAVGLAVGLMGIGGGLVAVPAMVYVVGMQQHLAQGTSLFLLLPPIGIGALWVYWKDGHVDLRAGILCALGVLLGGGLGGRIAIRIPSPTLRALFGLFLMFAAVMLWRKPHYSAPHSPKTND